MLKILIPIISQLNEQYLLSKNPHEKTFFIIKAGLEVIINKFQQEGGIKSPSDKEGIANLKKGLETIPKDEKELEQKFFDIKKLISNLNWPFYGASTLFKLHNYELYKTLWIAFEFLKNPQLLELYDYIIKRNHEIKLSQLEVKRLQEEINNTKASESDLKSLLALAKSNALFGEYEKAKGAIQQLTLENSILSKGKDELQNIINSQDKEISGLKKTIEEHEKTIDTCLKQITTLQKTNTQIIKKNDELEKRVKTVEDFLSHPEWQRVLRKSQGYEEAPKFNPNSNNEVVISNPSYSSNHPYSPLQ